MKPISITTLITFVTLITALLITGCGNNDTQHHQQEHQAQHEQTGTLTDAGTESAQKMEVPEKFRNEYAIALEAYFDLKDALVQTDASTASDRADELRDKILAIGDDGLSDEAHGMWVTHRELMITEAENIEGENNIEEQRIHFETLSESFIGTVKSFRPVGYTVYEQMCPMVRGGSANWLSKEEQIANPYHGERMMRCGSVVSRI